LPRSRLGPTAVDEAESGTEGTRGRGQRSMSSQLKLTPAERTHLLHYILESSGLKRGPATLWNGNNGILPHELLPLMEILNSELKQEGRTVAVEEIPRGPWAPPAATAEVFRDRIRLASEELKGSTCPKNPKIEGLTQRERLFLDHLEYEELTLPDEHPAADWLRKNGVTGASILPLVSIRTRERGGTLLHEKPPELFEPAWKTGEEARARAQELVPLLERMMKG